LIAIFQYSRSNEPSVCIGHIVPIWWILNMGSLWLLFGWIVCIHSTFHHLLFDFRPNNKLRLKIARSLYWPCTTDLRKWLQNWEKSVTECFLNFGESDVKMHFCSTYEFRVIGDIAELSKSLSCLSDNRSGRCGQCVRPIKHLPDLHIFLQLQLNYTYTGKKKTKMRIKHVLWLYI
jgi:hypothetical protein